MRIARRCNRVDLAFPGGKKRCGKFTVFLSTRQITGEGEKQLIDHILEHLDLADQYSANAARLGSLRNRSKSLLARGRQCRDAADRERAEAASHAADFGIDPIVLAQERAEWQRLRQYSLDHITALTLADVRWLRALVRHGRPCSRNVRRAAELLSLADDFLRNSREGNQKLQAAPPTDEAAEDCHDVPP